MGSLANFRYGLRTLRRSPGFTAAALLSLGLGIGANTAIFTLTSAVFLHPLPVGDPARVLELYTVDHATKSTIANLTRTGISLPNILDIRAQNSVFSGVAAYAQAGVTLTGFGKPSQENAFVVTSNYFDVLDVRPAAGRTFGPDQESADSGHPEVILSHGIAQRLFGSDAAAPGRALALNSQVYTVIGVAPADFRGTLSVGPTDPIWLPIGMHSRIFSGPIETLFNERRFRLLNAFGRLKPGVDDRRATANLQTIAARLEAAYPKDNRGRVFEVSSLAEAALGFAPRNQTVAAAAALSVAVGFVLLIACANLANLSLARAAKRSREMGIRVALGAPRGRLAGQLLAEAALLSAMGGAFGIAIGWAGAKLLWALRPGFLTGAAIDLHPDLRIVLFTAGLSAASCFLFGLAPMIRASAPDVSRVLNSGGRGNIRGGGRSPLRALLVVGEIALALMALVGAGLFVRSAQRAQNIDLGFETRNILVAGLNLGSVQMQPDRGRDFIRAIVDKTSAISGVESASVGAARPLGGGLLLTAFREGVPADSRLGVLSLSMPVSPGYFETMRIAVIEGRPLNAFDRMNTARVAVISQAMAKHVWPGEKALGKRFHFATQPNLYEVVGIARDSTALAIGETPQPITYLPFDQAWQPFAVLHVRTQGDPGRVLPAVAAAVQSLNPELALVNPGTVRDAIAQALWAPRMAAALFGVFGVLAMALALVGVYGVIAYMVLQRTGEIGIRMAVGAHSMDVIRMVLGQSMLLAVSGVGLGILGALSLTRLIGNLLFGVSPADPATFAGVAAILSATALLAAALPAWRASRIDPTRALREENS